MFIENARIHSTLLGFEEHGLLTASLRLKGAGWGQSFGGYQMSVYTGEWFELLLKAVGANSWETLLGLNIRVRRDELHGTIVAVGHIVEDKWFEPEKLKHLAAIVEKSA